MAAYTQGFVVSIIGSNGKVIRESNVNNQRVVRLPFDSEYKIRIQNKNLTRAYVKVLIDGTEVHTGKLILRGNSSVDLERFDLDGNLSSGRKFKFVPLTNSDVQDPTSKENGILEVIFEEEIVSGYTITTNHPHTGVLRGMSGMGSFSDGVIGSSFAFNNAVEGSNVATNSAVNLGATVEGDISTQAFVVSHENFATRSPVSIKIKMSGLDLKKDWQVLMNQGKMSVSVSDATIPHVEEISLTPTHLVIKVPIGQVQVG
jgi:hypothetical protein